MTARNTMALLCLCSGLSAGPAWGVDIQTVPVGNPGNAGELSGSSSSGGYSPDRICGSVAYEYRIGKYEVTAGQYCEFLNKVAQTDTYGLYNASMWSYSLGCKIQRSGTSGSYTYSVASDYANRPVNYVSWGDAARFANWLHNGQPTGAQGAGTTEDGAYYLNGVTTDAWLLPVARESGWKWAITSEDEWYKAAYHKNDGVTGNYFDYPTSSDSVPSNVLGNPADPGNNATFYDNGWTIGSPYNCTEVGAHENSDSPYGTFDQGGNVWEWNEAMLGALRGLRGGSWNLGVTYLRIRSSGNPSTENYDIGFRVSTFPSGGDADADADGDEVTNRHDQCPNTIPGIEVNADGCPQFIPGDFDRDGDVDGLEVGTFAACGSGPAVSASTGCEIMDFDGDNDVDQEDFGLFQVCISGESIPGDPACLPRFGMVLIPAGEFQMGNSFSGEGSLSELPRHAVHVGAFYMDRYEVTNYHYRDALNWANNQGLIQVSGGVVYGTGDGQAYCDTTHSSGYSGIQYADGDFSVKSGRMDHPMVMVTWYGAAAYANWRSLREGREPCYTLSGEWTCDFSKNGYRLPTEAEWEKAARGGADGRRFPWSDSDTIQHARANYFSSADAPYDNSPTRGYHLTFDAAAYPFTSPVGYFACNDYGLYDMAGNVLELCNDWYNPSYYDSSPYNNPTGPASGPNRVLRGGGWYNGANYCRVAGRGSYIPDRRYPSVGFRVALGSP